ncbi:MULTISPECIES: glutathione ABC transporter substrate-binding protein [unclassified Brenneria]|uniref:glutathione ABC transporter substrate-binding protein n=1 Tax=unclassified Brenneria TaxID=2634434 RepID=UPI00155466BC|nr:MULTISPECIES: glutathione ABC transporter substrate-binding protein [unclassified Brenneria]MBJ7223385.1 glutathione ABC transporter substrate-binding protein [Brenneria sp. L3-3C-1]MEE3644625.1 glutathione ABC transporter substrate-binding protein [Brenneria sp. L3_3C_1]MEE3652188.1 glutathione ABC transporter substrate-binding protein [Brenneria sp. HEZEL_4_2_4]NPD02147.1 glutathione ABC transporter substrate-binding protein [Brenneria sp. hezel4-2-4]
MKPFVRRSAVALGLSLCLAAIAQAQDLRISIYADITGLDPHDTSDTLSYSIQSGIFERLFQFDNKMKLEPRLAADYTSNEDATEFVITLREGITFQDGTPFNADAVKANLDRLADQTKGLKRNSLFKMIKTVTVISPTQVKIDLNQSFGAFVNTLAHPSAVMHSPEALKKYPDEAQLRVNPVGTGPFKFDTWQQGKDVKLVKYDNYWQKGWPKVDSVTFFPAPEDSTRVASLKSGQVDAIYPLPSDLLNAVQSDSKLAVQRDESIYFYYIALNAQHKPLQDVRVRQAINYAINRDMWLKVGFAGMGTPATSAMPPNVQFYQKQATPDYSYNPEKAKALLKEAGYANGLDLKLWTTNATVAVRSAQFLKQQLSQVGIRATVTPMDSGARNAKLWGVKDPKQAEFDLYYGGWSTSTGDADWALRPLFATESWVPTAYNVSYYSNPAVDKAIMAGLQTADPAKRAAAYADAQKLIWQDSAVAFLGAPDNLVGKAKNLSGVYMLADGSLIFDQAEFK